MLLPELEGLTEFPHWHFSSLKDLLSRSSFEYFMPLALLPFGRKGVSGLKCSENTLLKAVV